MEVAAEMSVFIGFPFVVSLYRGCVIPVNICDE
jgi:hypothetical protein